MLVAMKELKPMPTSRQHQLINWLEPWLTEPASTQPTLVAGDASFRSYYRLAAEQNRLGSNLIVMDAPPEKESSQRFIQLALSWHQQGLRVPYLYSSCEHQGFALLEDFGDQQLMQAVKPLAAAEADAYYLQALTQLAELQSVPVADLPLYSQELLNQEIQLFEHWLIDQLLQIQGLPTGWDAFKQRLVETALEQPQTLVHRDYHSRNLMVTEQNQLGILDFQDAVLGPCTYDAVSLIRDCYLEWPQNWQQHWLQAFQQQTYAHISRERFEYWFDWMGMQRHLKAAGIFARLCLRDNKKSYLQDLPLTLKHLQAALKKYPEAADILSWIEQSVEPAVSHYLAQQAQNPET